MSETCLRLSQLSCIASKYSNPSHVPFDQVVQMLHLFTKCTCIQLFMYSAIHTANIDTLYLCTAITPLSYKPVGCFHSKQLCQLSSLNFCLSWFILEGYENYICKQSTMKSLSYHSYCFIYRMGTICVCIYLIYFSKW